MVKRIESQYQHGGAVYYFETDDRSVKVLDENNNEVGTLSELAFNGKTVTGGDFKDIIHTGIYKVKGLSGLPGNVPADQECMLAVQTIGPGLKLYRLITPSGVIVENTVASNSESGWGSGGVDLRNTIDSINNSLGEIKDLQTKSKNLSSAINEVLKRVNDNQDSNNQRLTNLENKNFDDRYLLQTGGKMQGNIVMRNGYAYKFETNKGLTADLGYMDSSDKIHMGSWDYPVELNGEGDLMYNGEKVLTSSNINGSGFDAGSLGGLTANSFLHTKGNDSKYGKLTIVENALELKMKDGDNDAVAIRFIRGGKTSSSIHGNGTDDILLYPGKQDTKVPPFAFNHDLNFVQYGGAHFIRSSEPGVHFQTWDDDTETFDNGLSIIKPAWGKKELIVRNGNVNQIVAEFGVHDGEAMKINHSPYIGEYGRRLFLQDEQPTGDIPVGSVWIGF